MLLLIRVEKGDSGKHKSEIVEYIDQCLVRLTFYHASQIAKSVDDPLYLLSVMDPTPP